MMKRTQEKNAQPTLKQEKVILERIDSISELLDEWSSRQDSGH